MMGTPRGFDSPGKRFARIRSIAGEYGGITFHLVLTVLRFSELYCKKRQDLLPITAAESATMPESK